MGINATDKVVVRDMGVFCLVAALGRNLRTQEWPYGAGTEDPLAWDLLHIQVVSFLCLTYPCGFPM